MTIPGFSCRAGVLRSITSVLTVGTAVPVLLLLQSCGGGSATRTGGSPTSPQASHPATDPRTPLLPDVGVSGLSVDGQQVTAGQQVTVTGPSAARVVAGRFGRPAPRGDRFFLLTTPLVSGDVSKDSSYVQAEIRPLKSRRWSATAGIGKDGSYPAVPDRVTVLLATASVAVTLAGYEGKPGDLRPIPKNLAWRVLATVDVLRKPGSAGDGGTALLVVTQAGSPALCGDKSSSLTALDEGQ